MVRRQDVLQQGRLAASQVAREECDGDDPVDMGVAIDEGMHESSFERRGSRMSGLSLRSCVFGFCEDEVGRCIIIEVHTGRVSSV